MISIHTGYLKIIKNILWQNWNIQYNYAKILVIIMIETNNQFNSIRFYLTSTKCYAHKVRLTLQCYLTKIEEEGKISLIINE